MRLFVTWIVLSLAACKGSSGETDDTDLGDADTDADADSDTDADTDTDVDDADGDGFASSVDCDDTDATVNPGASEVCNGVDDNCDAQVDEGLTTTFYADSDGDGYGDPGEPVDACEAPSGAVADASDCDDADAAINPDAVEVCDSADADEDCDGLADDADTVSGDTTFYADSDGDGFGDPASSSLRCDADGTFSTADGTDCDDTDANRNPGEDEVCNAVDDDCDTAVDDDDDDVVGAPSWSTDGDGDGYGADSTAVARCTQPSGTTGVVGDCDDSDVAVNPGATEVCDAANVDEDCDALADNQDPDSVGRITYYADVDVDGYGDPADGQDLCDPIAAYALTDATDCDDDDPNANPGTVEVCDPADVDEDCDGLADDADPGKLQPTDYYYADADGDGFGDDADSVPRCDPSVAYPLLVGGDCDDQDAAINPDGQEVCDPADVDEDCDGTADDLDGSATGQTTWYADADSDGFGGAADSTQACDPVAFAYEYAAADDCDDTDALVYPGAPEVCDFKQDDCDASSWAESDEDGLVGYFFGVGGFEDWTADFAGGASGSPASLALPTDGELRICDGTYYVNLHDFNNSVATVTCVDPSTTILSAGGVGSVVNVSGTLLDMTIQHCQLTGGVGLSGGDGYYYGGGLAISEGSVYLVDDLLIGNTADFGGAIAAREAADVVLNGCELSSNAVTGDGGAVWHDGDGTGPNAFTFTGGSIHNNVAASSGGAILSGNRLVIDGTEFALNTAYDGSAVWHYGDNLLVSNANFHDNATSATNGSAIAQSGGAAAFDNATVTASTGSAFGLSGSNLDLVGGLISANATIDPNGGGAATLVSSGLTCDGTSILSNTGGRGAVVLTSSASTLDSTACNWGSTAASNNNTPQDVAIKISVSGYNNYQYDNAQTFSCSGTTCVP
jgi:hypothetical protein